MVQPSATDTGGRILAAALELFAAQGYQRTSLRQIAERLGISKAAVLYHFPAKDQILTALTDPLLADLETALDAAAARAEPQAARWTAVEGILDAFLIHRRALLMLRHDLSILTQEPSHYQRFLVIGVRAYEIIAGPGADLAAKVRASQAVAALGDPLVYFADAPVDELRAMILDGARRMLDEPAIGTGPSGIGPVRPGLSRSGDAARAGDVRSADDAGRRAGRPRALDAERLATARRMYAAGNRSITEIAAAVGVSRATLYRHLDR